MTSIAGAATVSSAGTGELRELIENAIVSRTPLRISGRAHWIDAGRPVRATRVVSLATHTGVIDYVPGDLTITVRAGTTLAEIESETRAQGQWLTLDPFGSDDGTIGATVSTGSFGPLAHGFGKPRDLVLGLEFITGDGKLVRGGGRVVKNVAGFDLVRLVTGSWGTLGIITELTLRLYSIPAERATVALTMPASAASLGKRIMEVLTSAVTPFAVELVDPLLASTLGLARTTHLLIEIGGNPAAVAAQLSTLSQLGRSELITLPVWKTLRHAEETLARQPESASNGERGSPAVVRLSSPPSQVASIWTAVRESVAAAGGFMHSSPGLGIVRCILPGETTVSTLRNFSPPGVTVIYERLPRAAWKTLAPDAVSDGLSRGVRHAFDPHDILNPGILGP